MELERSEPQKKKPGLYLRLKSWTLGWAQTPYGAWALGIVSFAESSFFPIPPDALLMPLCIGDAKKAFRFARLCTVASVLGGIFGYGLGAFLFDPVCRPYLESVHSLNELQETVKNLYQKYNALIVFVAGFSPIPYKLFTILGGYAHVNFPLFVIASLLSRGARFYIVAFICKKYGEKSIAWMERHMIRIAWIGAVVSIGAGLIWVFFFR